jgi:hypothetical protein
MLILFRCCHRACAGGDNRPPDPLDSARLENRCFIRLPTLPVTRKESRVFRRRALLLKFDVQAESLAHRSDP